MMGSTRTTTFFIIAAYLAGFLSHLFYQKWTRSTQEIQGYPVTFSPLPHPTQNRDNPPLVDADNLEKIRELEGDRARVRGRIFRVGHSSKSNTYFLNFGPSRSSFTGVVFSSALERFERSKISLMNYQGREVELTGKIRNHPRFGLEIIVEDPSQIRLIP